MSKRHVTRRRDEIHPGVKFQSGVNFFSRYTYLSPRAGNWKFPPQSEMDILTFLHDVLLAFILQKYRYSDNWQQISDNSYRLEKKENSCAFRFYISRFCKYCLLALYSCIEHWGEIGKLKEKLKYIHYLLFPGLTSNLFVQELGILNVNLRPALYGNILSYLI